MTQNGQPINQRPFGRGVTIVPVQEYSHKSTDNGTKESGKKIRIAQSFLLLSYLKEQVLADSDGQNGIYFDKTLKRALAASLSLLIR